jgi:hypothetical protein
MGLNCNRETDPAIKLPDHYREVIITGDPLAPPYSRERERLSDRFDDIHAYPLLPAHGFQITEVHPPDCVE